MFGSTSTFPSRALLGKVGLTVAVVTAAVAVTSVASLALFTDQETVGANTLGAGTIDLTTSPAATVLSMPSMAPGDQVTSPLTISNSGSLDLRYSMSSTTSEDTLAGALVLTVKAGVASCTTSGFAASGTTLYTGVLGSTSTTKVLGSNAIGADAGDRGLIAGATETLCLNVVLPSDTGSANEGAATTATFSFDAEQTRNN